MRWRKLVRQIIVHWVSLQNKGLICTYNRILLKVKDLNISPPLTSDQNRSKKPPTSHQRSTPSQQGGCSMYVRVDASILVSRPGPWFWHQLQVIYQENTPSGLLTTNSNELPRWKKYFPSLIKQSHINSFKQVRKLSNCDWLYLLYEIK